MKFILIGNSSVGKTALAWRYKYDTFIDYNDTTIGVDVQTKHYELLNDKVDVLLWDTAGQEQFQSIANLF